MRILLTNDDGVLAPGLTVLEKIARQLSDDIWIIAPSEENSGAGHSLTLNQPVRIRKHGDKHYSVTGTPTDSVMIGIGEIMKGQKPDLVLSGVNRGANLGDDVTYSGTVSAAMEGTLAGVRSIALSQVYAKDALPDDMLFAAAESWGKRVLEPLIALDFADRTLINVNFPALPPDQIKGIVAARQGFHDYARASIVPGRDPRGNSYYWFGLHGIEHTPGHDTDLEAIGDGFVSVSPLQLDLTNNAALSQMRSLYEDQAD